MFTLPSTVTIEADQCSWPTLESPAWKLLLVFSGVMLCSNRQHGPPLDTAGRPCKVRTLRTPRERCYCYTAQLYLTAHRKSRSMMSTGRLESSSVPPSWPIDGITRRAAHAQPSPSSPQAARSLPRPLPPRRHGGLGGRSGRPEANRGWAEPAGGARRLRLGGAGQRRPRPRSLRAGRFPAGSGPRAGVTAERSPCAEPQPPSFHRLMRGVGQGNEPPRYRDLRTTGIPAMPSQTIPR